MRRRNACWLLTATLGLVALLDAGAARAAAPRPEDLGVIPTPQLVTWTNDSLRVDEGTKILLPSTATDGVKFAVANFQERLEQQMGLKLHTTSDAGAVTGSRLIAIGNPKTDPRVARLMKAYGLELTEAMAQEGYVLGIGAEGIVIGAESDRGLLYGTTTLRQMLVSRGQKTPLPAVRVRDWPKMAMRGVHDEFSYGQVSKMDNFKDMIRFLADYKMNTLIFYFEDTFRFQRYPNIGQGRGALARADRRAGGVRPTVGGRDLSRLRDAGQPRRLIDARRRAPVRRISRRHSFATTDDAFGFLSNCFQEIADAFDSKYFHAGLDESWDLGFGKSEESVKRLGRGPAHAAHYRRINELLKSRGKTMIMYGDIILKYPEILDLIPKDIVLMDWQYEPADHYPTVDVLGSKGFPIIVLPGMSNWDRIFPDMSKAMINIRNFTLDCYRQPHPLGSITSTWGDNGSKNLRELLYYGYAYGAEVSWSPESTDVSSYSDRFFTLQNGPGTAPYFEAIYALLEKWPWWFPLLDYFRHPFLPRKDGRPHTTQELYRVYEDARTAQKLCDLLEPLVIRRKGDVDYLRYCADARALCRKPAAGRGSERVCERRFLERGEKRAPRPDSWNASTRYETKRPACATRSRTCGCVRTSRRICTTSLTSTTQSSKFGRMPQPERSRDNSPTSRVRRPSGSITQMLSKARPVQHAYFRKVLKLDPRDVASVGIQVQGDTHVKIYVNGTEVGEQFVRRNLSAPVNPKLLAVYDIKPQLKPGDNVIAIDAREYGTVNPDLEPGGPRAQRRLSSLWRDSRQKRQGAADPVRRELEGKRHRSARLEPAWPRRPRLALGRGDPHPTVWVTYPDFSKEFAASAMFVELRYRTMRSRDVIRHPRCGSSRKGQHAVQSACEFLVKYTKTMPAFRLASAQPRIAGEDQPPDSRMGTQ